MEFLRALLGLTVLLVIAWLCSTNRRRINWRTVAGGLLLAIAMAVLVFKVDWIYDAIGAFANGVKTFLDHTYEGTKFVFGSLGQPAPGGLAGFIFAFSSLATIIFVSAVMAILYHLGIMQAVVWAMAKVMTAVMRVSGAEALSVAANVFVGQTEAPLVIKPYIPKMTQSEIMALMVGGFATISGSLFATYMGFVGAENARHILTASVMAAPAAFVFAKMMVPETEEPVTGTRVEYRVERTASNVIDAASAGVSDGLKLWLNVIAMLIAFVALIAAINWPLGGIEVEGAPLSLERILGWLFAPLAWCLGVPWADCQNWGTLIGTKISLNEFVAYSKMGDMVKAEALGAKAQLMATFALCGFANFASVGIQLGGITPLAPEKRTVLAQLALRAMFAGAMASLLTATFAGAMRHA
jgi:CNT family concentrative nucleoside transporter